MSSPGPSLTADPPPQAAPVPAPEPPAGAAVLAPDEVLAVVVDLLGDVIGEDYVSALDVDLDTSFHDDLDIESIEFVALGEALEARYGDRVDFPGWIATMEVDDIIAMTVGQLVSHIVAGHG